MPKILQPPAVLGIVGGGQLGKMIAFEAKRMGYQVIVLDPGVDSPAGQIADKKIIASFQDRTAFLALADRCDVITYELEHVDTALLKLCEEKGCPVYPSPSCLDRIQDKFLQKQVLRNAGVPVPLFMLIPEVGGIEACVESFGFPLVLKTRFGGYDGRGVQAVWTMDELPNAFASLMTGCVMVEEFVQFERELSLIVARDQMGRVAYYPVTENIHQEGILRLTRSPAAVDPVIRDKAIQIAQVVMETLDTPGVFCIEMFCDKDQNLFVNEIAPRPHNTGHHSIEACETSQYEQLVRILAGMPLGSTAQRSPSVMVNLLGSKHVVGGYCLHGIERLLDLRQVYFHWYGKTTTSYLRKLGHVTVLDDSIESAEIKARGILKDFHIAPQWQDDKNLNDDCNDVPVIGIVMGSDSDLSVMNQAAAVLKELCIPYEIHITSAHRTPDMVMQYAKTAEERGLMVIIAGAGGAAHLPGMMAAWTCLPIIGVPVQSKSFAGIDSLLSIVQMPMGVPVATVTINGAREAGIIAARMVCIGNPVMRDRLDAYQEKQDYRSLVLLDDELTNRKS